jgi:hypothetical protein
MTPVFCLSGARLLGQPLALGCFRRREWIHPIEVFSSGRYVGGSVVASNGDEVVVLWRQRGLSPGGERFDGPVLALYTVREGRLARAQMFYFDTPGAGRVPGAGEWPGRLARERCFSGAGNIRDKSHSGHGIRM